jgi:5-methylcytosine-specific restriction protein A
MPTRPRGPCNIGKCPRLAVSRGRCELHPLPARTHELSATRRGYGVAWRRVVERAIAEQPWCSRCGHTGSPDNPLTGDHLVPVSRGGLAEASNVRVLCRRCNSAKGNRS